MVRRVSKSLSLMWERKMGGHMCMFICICAVVCGLSDVRLKVSIGKCVSGNTHVIANYLKQMLYVILKRKLKDG